MLQPLDQGIIRAVKAIYCKNMQRSLLRAIHSVDSALELCKKVTVLDAIMWLVQSWRDVKEDTIVKCFTKAGFCTSSSAETTVEDKDLADDDNVPLVEEVYVEPGRSYWDR